MSLPRKKKNQYKRVLLDVETMTRYIHYIQ